MLNILFVPGSQIAFGLLPASHFSKLQLNWTNLSLKAKVMSWSTVSRQVCLSFKHLSGDQGQHLLLLNSWGFAIVRAPSLLRG
jgi:hypothetical protein